MQIEFEGQRYSPATGQDISSFELTHNLSLPESYKKFLMEYNGGEPVPNGFAYEDGEKTQNSTVRAFLSLAPGEESLDYFLKLYFGRLPGNILPIAYDDFGNLICLCIEGNTAPVVFWDHELENDEKTLLFFIADDFDSFCNNLFAIDD